jgi:hypothetical protein
MHDVLIVHYHLDELRDRQSRHLRYQEHARALRESKGRHRYRSRRRR